MKSLLPLHPAQQMILYSLMAVSIATLAPFDFSAGTDNQFSWKFGNKDAFSNLFLLGPTGLALSLLLAPNYTLGRMGRVALLGALISLAVESCQLFIDVRTPQYWDVICNTLSMLLGYSVGAALQRALGLMHYQRTRRQQAALCSYLLLFTLIATKHVFAANAGVAFNVLLILIFNGLLIGYRQKTRRIRDMEYLSKQFFLALLVNIGVSYSLFWQFNATTVSVSIIATLFAALFMAAIHSRHAKLSPLILKSALILFLQIFIFVQFISLTGEPGTSSHFLQLAWSLNNDHFQVARACYAFFIAYALCFAILNALADELPRYLKGKIVYCILLLNPALLLGVVFIYSFNQADSHTVNTVARATLLCVLLMTLSHLPMRHIRQAL